MLEIIFYFYIIPFIIGILIARCYPEGEREVIAILAAIPFVNIGIDCILIILLFIGIVISLIKLFLKI